MTAPIIAEWLRRNWCWKINWNSIYKYNS
jgi:hypothetical protein